MCKIFPISPRRLAKRCAGFVSNTKILKLSNEGDLSAQDQQAVKQLVKRLAKNLAAKDGTPVSPQIIKRALEELLSQLQ